MSLKLTGRRGTLMYQRTIHSEPVTDVVINSDGSTTQVFIEVSVRHSKGLQLYTCIAQIVKATKSKRGDTATETGLCSLVVVSNPVSGRFGKAILQNFVNGISQDAIDKAVAKVAENYAKVGL